MPTRDSSWAFESTQSLAPCLGTGPSASTQVNEHRRILLVGNGVLTKAGNSGVRSDNTQYEDQTRAVLDVDPSPKILRLLHQMVDTGLYKKREPFVEAESFCNSQ